MVQAISDGLKGAGFNAEIRDLNYFQDDYGLKPIGGNEGDADDDDDDDDDDEVEVTTDGEGGSESVDIDGSEGYEIIEDGDDE